MVNLGEDRIFLPKKQIVGFLDPEGNDVSEIKLDINAIETPPTVKEKKVENFQLGVPSDFITSPADVARPRKATLQDLKVTEEETKAFKDLCEKYSDVFSENSGDIGRTSLIKMDIDTGVSNGTLHVFMMLYDLCSSMYTHYYDDINTHANVDVQLLYMLSHGLPST